MKASDYIVDFLHERGVRRVYEVVGGMITHLVDSLHRDGRIRIVSVQHEQGAAFAADAEGRMTGVPGVAMATSGPGATNLLTGIGSCFLDSSPAVFITGQVNVAEQRGRRRIRQLGFQEVDIVSMAKPVTKAAWLVNDARDIPDRLDEAFRVAREGRPGPVLVDIPMDLQRADIRGPIPKDRPARGGDVAAPRLAALFRDLAKAERPLVLVGGGLRASRSSDLFRLLVERINVPVAHSLMAVDALPSAHPLRVGMIGSYGNRWVNLAIGRCDFLLVLGSRLDIRQTGSDTKFIERGRTIYHVDCEDGEINNRVLGCHAVRAHLADFLKAALRAAGPRALKGRAAWTAELAGLMRQWPDVKELDGVRGINPNVLMHELSAASRRAGGFIADVGQHQMWAGQSLDLGPGQSFLTSGGMGAMGFALPAAIGAAFAANRPVVMIAGDGGFQLNIQELQTVVRNKLPVKMVILNNRCHGMVRQFQESYFDERYQSTLWGYSAPDFEKVAQAYGIAAHTVSRPDGLKAALARLWADARKPFLLQVMIDTYANVYPKIAFGKPLTHMEPQVKPVEMEGT